VGCYHLYTFWRNAVGGLIAYQSECLLKVSFGFSSPVTSNIWILIYSIKYGLIIKLIILMKTNTRDKAIKPK
jgi:hypothetical protein